MALKGFRMYPASWYFYLLFHFFYFLKRFFYLLRERQSTGRVEGQRDGEKQTPL